MERGRKGKTIALLIMVGIILTLSVGYAAMSRILTIRGAATMDPAKWDIHFENLKAANITGKAEELSHPKIQETEKIEVNDISVKLYTPGAKVEYRVDIVNRGDMNAYVEDIIYSELSNAQKKYLNFKLIDVDTKEELARNTYLAVGETKRAIIRIEYIEDINEEDLPKETDEIDLSVAVTFKQTSDEQDQIISNDPSHKQTETIDISANSDNSVKAIKYADKHVVISGEGAISNNASEQLAYYNEDLVNNYKEILSLMGYTDIDDITTMSDLEEYAAQKEQSGDEKISMVEDYTSLYIYKSTLNEMGYTGTESITDMESLMSYMQEEGLVDTEGNFIDSDVEATFMSKSEEIYNEKFNSEPQSPTNIILEEGVTNIPEGLYTGNENITEVEIPTTVTTISDRAFYGCTNLTSITIPSNVTSIGNNAFDGCTNLVSVEAGSTPTSAMGYVNKISNVEQISKNISNVTSIGIYAFYNCRSLTAIEILDKVTEIKNGTFQNCSSLSSVDLTNMVGIGQFAFSGCTNLVLTEIPTTIESIGNSAFEMCNNITKLTVDATKNYGYFGISSLEELNLIGTGNMTNNIPWSSSNSTINKVTISNTITSIVTNAFSRCTGLTEITIPNSITTIGTYAFSGCSNIVRITIPSSVSYISTTSPFKDCTGIEEVEITGSGGLLTSSSMGGNGYKNTPWYESRNTVKKITLSNNITSLGNDAFSGCSVLTSINIPTSLTTVGNGVFSGCASLEELIIPNTVTSMGGNVFSQCTNLKSVTLPNTITSIGTNTFNGCTSLERVEIPNTVTSIDNYAFCGCTSLTSITIPNSVTNISLYTFVGCTGLINVNIGSGVSTLPYFDYSEELLSINIDSNNTNYSSIDGVVFNKEEDTLILFPKGWRGEYTIPDGVVTINTNVLSDCKKLTVLNVPSTVSSFNDSFMKGCTRLTAINIATGNSIFSSINGVLYNETKTVIYRYPEGKQENHFSIPSNVTSIGRDAFFNCKNLTSITIPTSVTYINGSAFKDCTHISSITIPNSVSNTWTAIFSGWTSSQTINIDNTSSYVSGNWNTNWKTQCNATVNYLRD